MANRIGKYKVSAKESLFSVIDGGTIGGRMVWGSETLTEDGDAANPDIPLTILDHDGDEGITLADGTVVGQMKIFISSTNNTVTLTPASTSGNYSTIATTNVGETYGCVWTADGWNVIMRASGDTAADNAVDDLPVLA